MSQNGSALGHEYFVPAEQAAKFLGIPRRFLLALARGGMKGAYPIGTGKLRKKWVFLLSELASAVVGKADPQKPGNVRSSASGSLR